MQIREQQGLRWRPSGTQLVKNQCSSYTLWTELNLGHVASQDPIHKSKVMSYGCTCTACAEKLHTKPAEGRITRNWKYSWLKSDWITHTSLESASHSVNACKGETLVRQSCFVVGTPSPPSDSNSTFSTLRSSIQADMAALFRLVMACCLRWTWGSLSLWALSTTDRYVHLHFAFIMCFFCFCVLFAFVLLLLLCFFCFHFAFIMCFPQSLP